MKLGDIVHAILRPFVEGTHWENCADCAERQKRLNQWSASLSNWLAKISCPCYWRSLIKRK